MRSSLVLLASAALAGVTTAYKDIANQNGFPNPTADQLKIIGDHADGTLSNAPPPPKLNDSSVPVFQLINFNENFEVAFFASLIHNITADLEGYKLEARRKKEVLEILDTVLAQEQLHAINAAKTLKNFQKFQPDPCSYFFPVTNILEAFAFAERFTDLVLGTLQDAAQTLARNGDVGPVRGVASSLGQEGQQSGFYRIILKKKPSEKPFLTTNVGPFLFSFVNRYVVPGSCPFTLSHIPLSIFPALKIVTGGKDGAKIEPKTQTITFSADLEKYSGVDKYVGQTSPSLWITYFSGQLLPISRRVTNVRWEGRKVTLDAEFPFEENTMIGLTVAALTDKAEFKAPGEVVTATIAAPGLIQVDDEVHSFDE